MFLKWRLFSFLMVKSLRISDKAHESLDYYRSCFGYGKYYEVFENLDIKLVISDIVKGINYIKKHPKSDTIIKRVRHVLSWINKELEKEIHLDYKEELLKLKIFCEEYLR